MARENIQIELSLYIKATSPAELPLEIYDALYYSGHFNTIYRVQGDMVLSAYYTEQGTGESRLARMGRRILKELTIDVKEKPKGVEVKVENLMPVFEEEASFYRDPKVRISTKARTTRKGVPDTAGACMLTLSAAERILLGVQKLSTTLDARLSITIEGGEFNSERMKEVHSGLAERKIRSSSTKHVWNIDFSREDLDTLIKGDVMPALEGIA